MKRLIVNPAKEEEFIAEIIGQNAISIEKRKTDIHPLKFLIKGENWDVVANGSLTGTPIHIECVDGKITEEDLTIVERKDDGEKEDDTKDPKGGQPNTGTPGNTED